MTDVMLDLETLDVAPTAVVLSIGAYLFDPGKQDDSPAFERTFYKTMGDDISAQQNNGRTISGNTVRWWMNQGALAQAVFAGDDKTNVALIEFAEFIEGNKVMRVWGNGAAFDNVILRSLYESYGVTAPWSYNGDRCYRTAIGMYPKQSFFRFGTHHNALNDAASQALHLQKVLACRK